MALLLSTWGVILIVVCCLFGMAVNMHDFLYDFVNVCVELLSRVHNLVPICLQHGFHGFNSDRIGCEVWWILETYPED